MPIIATSGLTHIYDKGTPFKVAAINDISIEIEKGEFVGIIGHTGSGKSTLIQHLNGLLKPDSGKVYLNGKDIWESKKSVRQARFSVGLCFQYPEYQLFEETVYKDIAFGPQNMQLSQTEISDRVKQAAEYVGLKPELLEKSPFDLSGGEKRRAAIAGVMAMQPEVLILDEPTAGLDPVGRDKILKLIDDYRKSTGSTVILVSHSMEDVANYVERIIVMRDSRVEMVGSVAEVYSRGEELDSMGLGVPQITKIFKLLKDGGLDVRDDIFTIDQGLAELERFFAKGAPND
ncbi:MAG TPA: energy-coupling factor transporter ATPase [Clostridiales bacterium]|nr:energy-coupling factor transporter ATPase [Clostridiales bacterium]